MDYAFFLGESFSHCGVNTFTLARQADGEWRTIAVADTRTPGAECDLNADEIEETAARIPLRNYLRGHATGDGSHHEKAFDPIANLYWVTDEGLTQRSSEAYIAGASGQPAGDEAERARWIEWVDVDGSAATAKIILDYPSARFADYMQLLKIDGEWKIVNKIFDVERR
ncbi:MAG: nuclear transport factor 2 family protein [Rhodothermales bacterium]|nr:nuclear transport factor 2 family protein [Rhodothermales bacterium]